MNIFLGYPSEHRSAADEVYSFLVSLGHPVWMDRTALVGGTDWRRERELAQRRADFVVHLCAEEMMSRPGDVNREIKLTLDLTEDQPLGALFAVFVRLSNFRLPIELTRFQYIDKFRDDWQGRLETAVHTRSNQLSDPGLRRAQGETMREASPIHGDAEFIEVVDNVPPDEASAQYLRYDRAGVYWQWINSEIAAKALGGYFDAKRAFKEARTDVDPEWTKDRSFSWELTTEEFFLSGQLLSVRFYTYDYLGGAHPNHRVESLNFIGPESGLLDIRELLGDDFDNARRLIDYCERVVVASFADEESPADFHLLDKNDEERVWQALEQFNLDSRGVTFNFSPYVVMAYAFGTQTVIVPWSTMQSFLDGAGQTIAGRFTSPNAS
jgi:hypothetical protein